MNNNTVWKDRKHFMWFPISFTKYEIKNERLYQETGLFNTHYDELLLYRITDLCLKKSLAQKIFGTGTIVLSTKADSDKEVLLKNVKNPKEVKDLISHLVEEARDRKKVVGKEFFDDSSDDLDDFDL
ncbi:PH domain-containing protein [uncultured Thomasclavelia sp.]|uniref:PH domain-containing protein n=1 Tax=uncultured Thomasclavelia sp. TaxID=3025759 RepID=UPI002633BA75|nr:PH domain-containing protein [uncultured Thomasclavelia sp.]